MHSTKQRRRPKERSLKRREECQTGLEAFVKSTVARTVRADGLDWFSPCNHQCMESTLNHLFNLIHRDQPKASVFSNKVFYV